MWAKKAQGGNLPSIVIGTPCPDAAAHLCMHGVKAVRRVLVLLFDNSVPEVTLFTTVQYYPAGTCTARVKVYSGDPTPRVKRARISVEVEDDPLAVLFGEKQRVNAHAIAVQDDLFKRSRERERVIGGQPFRVKDKAGRVYTFARAFMTPAGGHAQGSGGDGSGERGRPELRSVLGRAGESRLP